MPYIDRDALSKQLEHEKELMERGNTFKQTLIAHIIGEVKNEVDRFPTADVAPVIHAHWIPKKEMLRSPEEKNYNCSACGKESFAYPNCPFCRAIMDEGVKK